MHDLRVCILSRVSRPVFREATRLQRVFSRALLFAPCPPSSAEESSFEPREQAVVVMFRSGLPWSLRVATPGRLSVKPRNRRQCWPATKQSLEMSGVSPGMPHQTRTSKASA